MQLFQSRALAHQYAAPVVFGTSYTRPNRLRGVRLVALGSFLILITASVSAIALTRSYAAAPAAAPAFVTSQRHAAAETAPAATPPPHTPAAAPHSAASAATVIPACARGTYNLPNSLPAANRAAGVYVTIDPAASYRVFGTDRTAVMQQMADCTPVRSGGVFAANTGYSLSDYYTYGAGNDGLCHIQKVVVTQHINQVFPAWTGTNGASASFQTEWDQFIGNLRTHEQGHVNLDTSYAHKLQAALVATPAQSCTTIRQAADSTANRVMEALAAANENYDAQTEHGTTQGAVL